ncbi:MAG: hypothetical protein ABIR71_03720 [Chthoniobacterales bacterium]
MNARPASSGRPWFNLLAASLLILAAVFIPASAFAGDDEFRAANTADYAPSTNTAKNLARMNSGAQIEWTAPDGKTTGAANANDEKQSPAVLIMDDDTISCPLQEGQTTLVIKLPAAAALDRFSFVNENAEAAGQLKISVSNYRLPASSPMWVEVDGSISFARKRLFNLSMVGVEARYVKLSFQVEKAGRIASLGLYGGETLDRFAWRQEQVRPRATWVANTGSRSQTPADQLNFNFANLYAKARVVHVSSGALASAGRMIDDDNETGFHFAASDKQPTVVVELGENEQLHRVSALYKLQVPGRLDVYLLNEVSQDSLKLNDQQPIASVVDSDGQGKAAVDFDPRGARYVALRWTPSGVSNSERGFEIAEIDAFGNMPLVLLTSDGKPDLLARGYTSIPMPGEGLP